MYIEASRASPFSLRTVLSPDERKPNPSLVTSQHRNPAAGSINLQLLRHHHHRPSKPLHALPLGLAGMQMQPRNPIGRGSITRHTTRRSRTTCVQPAAHRQYGEMQLSRPRFVLHLHDAFFLSPWQRLVPSRGHLTAANTSPAAQWFDIRGSKYVPVNA
ncbi:hypothetical protein M441DRAFT_416903 [Trichoderma asperellum CBS 433.97]|uniref:Uncharacterized protein n=1 Tax=Trichoderma asperellum (strain ATCC 204424 / CBS 433.97 / NBRC 101777) TaxID=1042311 RepID=A0A2T3Z8B7_TRIA4|nr:hypothetical protein M441DRAFT_416903 [Trichoderma asperellum CBS 433.97]PTB41059.1 hypothetical protein M441DRAFT_416903 [Trichoderma asperellum CBS 433.97]